MSPWLDDLLSGNADDQRVRRVVDEHLAVTTRADGLPDEVASGRVRALLLVAHAGDGKSHLIRRIEDRWDRSLGPVHPYPAVADLDLPGLHVLNDPSPLDREVARRFFDVAFGGAAAKDVAFVAGANRGLLRELRTEAANEWLECVQRAGPAAHHPDAHGRLAVPLDLRCLVPGPAARGAATAATTPSLAGELAARVLGCAARESNTSIEVTRWAERIAVVLAMVEGSGHHVTFREVGALAAWVAKVVCDGGTESEPRGLRALFLERECPQSLLPLVSRIRRADPARVATPEVDVRHADVDAREHAVRRDNLNLLLSLFAAHSTREPPRMPYRHGVAFLRLCGEVAEANAGSVRAQREIAALTTRTPALERALGGARRELAESGVPASREAVDEFLVGLSRVAWSAPGRHRESEALPLTSALQPGTVPGVERWRVLRAALGLDRLRFAVQTADPGPWVETGLVLPELRVHVPEGDTPGLRLDLELFELLSRAGERAAGLPVLGAREGQIRGWLEAVAAAWEPALARPADGFIVYQTLIRAGTSERDNVPLRPPAPGPKPAPASAPPLARPLMDVLRALWGASPPVAVTPAACASALLLWAGARPTDAVGYRRIRQGAPAEALGAGTLRSLRTFKKLKFPCFPWSPGTLGLVLFPAGDGLEPMQEVAPLLDLGGVCASALGLDREWAPGLRGAWARDEERLDDHPSSLLAHQWLDRGAGKIQLGAWLGGEAPLGEADPWQETVRWLLSREARIGAPERWWLLGTWAAWRLFLEGIRARHGVGGLPLLLPRVGGDGEADYEAVRKGWLLGTGADRDCVLAVGQAAGFVRSPSLKTRVDLPLTGPGGLADVVRLAAGHLSRTRRIPAERRVDALQEILLDLGLYTLRGGTSVRSRLPPMSLARASPISVRYEAELRACLEAQGLLDTASDGAALVRDPWPGGER